MEFKKKNLAWKSLLTKKNRGKFWEKIIFFLRVGKLYLFNEISEKNVEIKIYGGKFVQY